MVGVLVAIEEWRIAGLRGAVDQLERDLAAAKAEIPPPPRPEPPGEAPDEALRRTKARRMMERVREVDAAAAAEPAPTGQPAGGPTAALRGMIGNPEGRAMIQAQLRGVVIGFYGELIEQFGLDQDEADYFIDMLVDGMTNQQQLGLDLLAAATEDERAAIRRQIAEVELALLDQVRVFLDDETDFAIYQQFVGQLPERQEIPQAPEPDDQ